MPNDDSEKRLVSFDEYDKFRFRVINDMKSLKEDMLIQKIEVLEKLHEQSVSSVRLEGILASFTESVQSIKVSMDTINTKIDDVNDEFRENDSRVRSVEEQLKRVVGKKENHSEEDSMESESSKAKWWSGFFVFLGIAIPAIIEKVDVILDFILKLRGWFEWKN